MIPSNFAFEQYVDANSLPLQPDEIYPMPMAAAAHYSKGHLNSIGHDDNGNEISYEAYSAKYKQVLGNTQTLGQDHFDRESFVSAMDSAVITTRNPIRIFFTTQMDQIVP